MIAAEFSRSPITLLAYGYAVATLAVLMIFNLAGVQFSQFSVTDTLRALVATSTIPASIIGVDVAKRYARSSASQVILFLVAFFMLPTIIHLCCSGVIFYEGGLAAGGGTL